jgi:hypothetical protein
MASITTGGIPEFLSGGHVARNETAKVTMTDSACVRQNRVVGRPNAAANGQYLTVSGYAETEFQRPKSNLLEPEERE